jgi:neurexin
VLVQNEDGEPSSDLLRVLSPALKPSKVTYRGRHQCESVIRKQEAPRIPKVLDTNYPPTLRNHVDHINATVGSLLVYKVPEVTTILFIFLLLDIV